MIQKEIDSFLKCDLHLHSSTDYSRNYTKKDFIKKLSLVDLDVISITDHNIIDISLYNEIKNNNKIEKKIIGGCELNISLSDSEISKYKLKTTGNFFHGIIWFDIDDIDMMWNILKEYIKSHDEKIGNIEDIDLTELSRKLANFSFKLDELQQCIKNLPFTTKNKLTSILTFSLSSNLIYKIGYGFPCSSISLLLYVLKPRCS